MLEPGKALHLVSGQLTDLGGEISGYEIHCGNTTLGADSRHFITLADGRYDGAVSSDGQVAGSYLHGLFDSAEACEALLKWAGLDNAIGLDRDLLRERDIERLADAMEEHLDLPALFPQWFAAA